MQSQSEAIMAMAEAVQQLSKQISNFLFAQRQSGQQRQQQRGDNNLGKTAELNKKGEREWDRIEGLARAKLVEIRTERERQAEQKSEQQNTDSVQWKAKIEADFDGVEEEIQKAMRSREGISALRLQKDALQSVGAPCQQVQQVQSHEASAPQHIWNDAWNRIHRSS